MVILHHNRGVTLKYDDLADRGVTLKQFSNYNHQL